MRSKQGTKHVRELVDGLSGSIPIGRSLRVDCPACGGNKSFSIRNDSGKIKYNCFKSSCSIFGDVEQSVTRGGVQAMWESSIRPDGFSPPEEYHIPAYFRRQRTFIDKYRQWDTYLDVRENRKVFIVHDQAGTPIDAVGRAIQPGRKPKWKRYASSQYPFVAGYGRDSGVLVEDVISAIAVADTGLYTGIALMGTNLQTGSSTWLKGFKRMTVALDYDASAKAVDMVRLLNWTLPTRQVILEEDLKFYSTEEVKEILK